MICGHGRGPAQSPYGYVGSRDVVMIGLAALIFAASVVRAEEEPRLDPLALSEIEQALAYHRAVSAKVIEVAVENYPPESLRARETGRVILALDINPNGSLAAVEARGVSDAPARLIDAAIAAAKSAAPFEQYDPGLLVLFRHVEMQIDYAIQK